LTWLIGILHFLAIYQANYQRGHIRMVISLLDIYLGGKINIGNLSSGRTPHTVPRARDVLDIFGEYSETGYAGIVGVGCGRALDD